MAQRPDYRKANSDENALFQTVRDTHHEHLGFFEIALLFRSPPRKQQGQDLCGSAHTANDAVRHLSGADGWVEIADDFWDGEEEEWQAYLLDHELRHFGVKAGALAMQGHEFEDFEDVLERHDPAVTGLRRLYEKSTCRDVSNGR